MELYCIFTDVEPSLIGAWRVVDEEIELVLVGLGGGSKHGGAGYVGNVPTDDFRNGGGGGINPGQQLWS